MSTFAVLLLCIQACLVQNVFGQYISGLGSGCGLGLGQAAAIAPSAAWGAGIGPAAYGGNIGLGGCGGTFGSTYGDILTPAATYGAYGGTGEGNVVVFGELPVGGTTAVAGQVPIMGAVNFGGTVPAAGAVSIAGQCACGCDSPIYY